MSGAAGARSGAALRFCLHGSSSLGKSTLARRFVAELRTAGEEALVPQGRCAQQEHVHNNHNNAQDGIVN
ncbi:MAG: hypothetical protein RMK29_03205 [Myxococcales bacterium]|nr:hypothetical protein [Myxococcota bacterium]MDW8280692.1 hypothetical protein [Myxococcales bacterium]